MTQADLLAAIRANGAKLRATDPSLLVRKFERTVDSIRAYAMRGGRNSSMRWYDLADRYEDMKSALRSTPEGYAVFREFCNASGCCESANANDFLA